MLLMQFIVCLFTDCYFPFRKYMNNRCRPYMNISCEPFLNSSSEEWGGWLLTMHKVTRDLCLYFFFYKIEGCEEGSPLLLLFSMLSV